MSLSILAFLLTLLLFVFVGVASLRYQKPSPTNYLVANRNVHPTTMALSMVSTCNSGWMFVGFIGAIYTLGISATWLMVGWIIGDLIIWLSTYRKLRKKTQALNIRTIPSYISQQKNFAGRSLRIITSLFILIFIGIYTAAQLKAGGKALLIMLDWPTSWGILISSCIILIYCLAGGLRASIWTDTVQSILMLFAMGILLFFILHKLGGFKASAQQLKAISPQLTHWRPVKLQFGFPLFLLGWFSAGIGIIGQPHIIIRAFAINHPRSLTQAAWVYYTWYILFTMLCTGVGLGARILLPSLSDPELALPLVSHTLLPPILIGITLAGLFAATISTADSQVLSCSACLSQDLFPRFKDSYFATKISTFFIIIFTTALALFSRESVFNLVVIAWSLLASCLAPLMIIKTFDNKLGPTASLLIMLSGGISALFWRYALNFQSSVYEALPGMAIGFLLYGIVKLSYKSS